MSIKTVKPDIVGYNKDERKKEQSQADSAIRRYSSPEMTYAQALEAEAANDESAAIEERWKKQVAEMNAAAIQNAKRKQYSSSLNFEENKAKYSSNGQTGGGDDHPAGGTTGSSSSGSGGSSDGGGKVPTYGEYVGGSSSDLYDETYNEQLAAIEEATAKKLAAIEEQKASDLKYSEDQYQILIDAINAQKESGTALATEQRDLLLSMSERERQLVYEAAEAQRAEEYRLAEIARERGIVDARSAYEQNKASYGRNAEALADMGLTGSGYGDYITSQAYATERAETQAENAMSETRKREARYAENLSKSEADLSHNRTQYEANAKYSQAMHDVDTTYASNLADAESARSTRDYTAESTARSSMLNAETDGKNDYLDAKMSYADYLAERETAAKAETAAKNTAFAELLSLANGGDLTAEQLEMLAKNNGLDDNSIKVLKDAATKAQELIDTYLSDTPGYTTYTAADKDALIDMIRAGTATEETIENALEDGFITSSEAESYKKLLKDAPKLAGATFNKDGDGRAAINTLGALTLTGAFFGEDVKEGTVTNSTPGRAGNNFSIRVGSGSDAKVYRVQYSGEAVSPDAENAGKSVKNDEVFAHGGKLYIKKNGKIYHIEERSNTYKKDSENGYQALYNLFYPYG